MTTRRTLPRGTPFRLIFSKVMSLDWLDKIPLYKDLSSMKRLVAAGGLILLTLLGLWAFYTQFSGWENRTEQELIHWGLVLLLLFAYGVGYRAISALKKTEASQPTVSHLLWGGALMFGLAALVVPAFHSTDLFGYVNRGWQQLAYNTNPYLVVIDDIPDWRQDPMFANHWINNPCPYGFTFALLTRFLCRFGGGDHLQTLLIFKGFNLLVFLLVGLLIDRGARKLNLNHPERGLYLYLWNPLLIVHTLINGHNDLLMAALMLWGLYIALFSMGLTALPMLVGGTLVKYAAGLTMPFTFFYLAMAKSRKVALFSAVLGMMFAYILAVPYLPEHWPTEILSRIGQNATVIHNSFPSLFYYLFKAASNAFPSLYPYRMATQATIKWVFIGAFIFWYGREAFRFYRQTQTRDISRERLIEVSLLTQLMLVCVASAKFYAWYLAMFFPLALWLKEGHWLRRLVVALSCYQLFAITFLGQAHIINTLLMLGVPFYLHGWKVLRPSHPETQKTARHPQKLKTGAETA